MSDCCLPLWSNGHLSQSHTYIYTRLPSQLVAIPSFLSVSSGFPATLIRHSFGCPHPIAMILQCFQPRINTSIVLVSSPLPTLPAIYPHSHSFIALTLSSLFSTRPSMKTREKNKSKHPAASVMTPAQLAAAGISQPQPARPRKKLTKDQWIAALEEDLCVTRELLETVLVPP